MQLELGSECDDIVVEDGVEDGVLSVGELSVAGPSVTGGGQLPMEIPKNLTHGK